MVIVARTDAKQAVSFEEALYRAAAFADAGADVVFVDALETVDEMKRFCKDVKSGHKMANMLEGGGKTPILSPQELEDMGFKLCAYPLSLLGVSIAAMQDALQGLKQGKISPMVPKFTELQSIVGFPDYFEEEAKYAVASSSNSNTTTTTPPSNSFSDGASPSAATSSVPPPPRTIVEADAVVEPNTTGSKSKMGNNTSKNSTIDLQTTVDLVAGSRDDEYKQREDRRAQWLRIKISDKQSGAVKLDTRFPAGFLNSVAGFVPQVAGLDLEGLVKKVKGDTTWSPDMPLLDSEIEGDRIEIFLEFER